MSKTIKALHVSANPCFHYNGGYRTSISLMARADRPQFTVTGTTPEECRDAILRQLAEYDLPESPDYMVEKGEAFNCWALYVEPANGRWAPGFKAAFKSNHGTYVDVVMAS